MLFCHSSYKIFNITYNQLFHQFISLIHKQTNLITDPINELKTLIYILLTITVIIFCKPRVRKKDVYWYSYIKNFKNASQT